MENNQPIFTTLASLQALIATYENAPQKSPETLNYLSVAWVRVVATSNLSQAAKKKYLAHCVKSAHNNPQITPETLKILDKTLSDIDKNQHKALTGFAKSVDTNDMDNSSFHQMPTKVYSA